MDEACVDLDAHAAQQRQEGPRKELEGRARRIVGAALQDQARGRGRAEQCRQYGLGHQGGAACRADGEVIVASPHRSRPEADACGSDTGAGGVRAGYFRRGA